MAETTYIALAGNPNCGKTTLFNELTGSNGYVGNWPGVTVEKKQAPWKKDRDVELVDLPGIYSLSPYSPEEVVSRDFLVNDRPDAVVDLIDVTNLERNLYLTTQVLEAGRPVVVGLNMCDLLKERGDAIDAKKLSSMLGVPVVEVSALRNRNLDKLMQQAVDAARDGVATKGVRCFSPEVESALQKVQAIVGDAAPADLARWYAIKVFERDADAIEPLALSKAQLDAAEEVIAAVEKSRDDDAESIVTGERYDWIATVMDACVKKAPKRLTTSQKIDRVVTNRVLGLPIFAAVMIAVYWVALVAVGTPATDWVNDNLFSDGFFVNSASQQKYDADTAAYEDGHYADKIDGFLAAADEKGIDTSAASKALAADTRSAADERAIKAFEAEAAGVVARDVPQYDGDGNLTHDGGEVVTKLDANGNAVLSSGQKLDVIKTVTLADFKRAVNAQEPDPHDYAGFVDSVPSAVTGWLQGAGASDAVVSLVVDGVIGGVGSVLGFIPQIFVLFVLLCFLEDCGYMSRVAFVMDRVFRRFGLSGKSFIPMIVSSGCGVPGVLATKTIENERDRRMTAMLTTMIPCSAKLPIIALVFGALAGAEDSTVWWVAPLFYFMGVTAIIVSGIMLRKTRLFAGEATPFVMELPQYHVPTVRFVLQSSWDRIKSYCIKAGTIIFLSTIVIWFLLNFGFGEGSFGLIDRETQMDSSLMAYLGKGLAWIFIPLGFGDWQATVTAVTGLVAKENVVATMGILTSLGSEVGETDPSLWSSFAAMFGGSAPAIMAFCAFNLLCAPCFAAIGTIWRQMGNAKWTWIALGYMTGFAYVVGLIIYQLGMLLSGQGFGFGTVIAVIALAGILFQLFRPMPHFEDKKDEAVVENA